MFRKNKSQDRQHHEPVIVAECRCANDAEVTKSILESNGIPCMILDSSLGMERGYVRVIVKKTDFEAAKKIIHETA